MSKNYDTTPNGIWYDFSFVPTGVVFTIFKKDNDTLKDVEEAKRYLKENRDVRGKINVIKVTDKGGIK